MSDDLVDRLRLVRSPGIGPVTYRQLIARFGSAAAALQAVPDLAARGGGKPPRLASRSDAEREIARVEALGGALSVARSGTVSASAGRTRRRAAAADREGRPASCSSGRSSRWSARETPRRQRAASRGSWPTTSGSRAWWSSPASRAGSTARRMTGRCETGTIGVIAGGLDIFYPPENQARQEAMSERGLVIAEMPPGTEPRARHFPYRNRIIAGLSAGHGRRRGGATIRIADHRAARSGGGPRGHGRPGLAARSARPGLQPAHPRRRDADPERRRRAGGGPAAAAALCIAAIRLSSRRSRNGWTATAERSARSRSLLGPSPVPVDEIIRLSGVPSGAVQMALLELDLAGRLDRHAGGKVSLRPA